jgi:hypothetical protein
VCHEILKKLADLVIYRTIYRLSKGQRLVFAISSLLLVGGDLSVWKPINQAETD